MNAVMECQMIDLDALQTKIDSLNSDQRPVLDSTINGIAAGEQQLRIVSGVGGEICI
jgi:hypothetical protein